MSTAVPTKPSVRQGAAAKNSEEVIVWPDPSLSERGITKHPDRAHAAWSAKKLKIYEAPPRRGAASLISLEKARSHDDHKRLGELTAALVRFGEDFEERKALQQWIKTEGHTWVMERRAALSAVIEAAVRLALDEVTLLIEQVLANPDSPAISASVAAQRIRRLVISPDEPQRSRLAGNVLRWIRLWESSAPMKAAWALPSLPSLMGVASLGELSSRIERAPPLIAWAAATGLADWLQESQQKLPVEDAIRLFDSIRVRIEQENSRPAPESSEAGASVPDLRAVLVLLMGQVATSSTVDAAASAIAKAFLTPRGLEDATAVQAGRIIVTRLQTPAMRALSLAFGPAIDELYRFATLLISKK